MRLFSVVTLVLGASLFVTDARAAVHSSANDDIAKIAVGPKSETDETSVTADALAEHDPIIAREPAAAAPTPAPLTAPKRKVSKPAKAATTPVMKPNAKTAAPSAKAAAVQEASDTETATEAAPAASSAVDGDAEDNVDKPVRRAHVQSVDAPTVEATSATPAVEPTEAWVETPAATTEDENALKASAPTMPKAVSPVTPKVIEAASPAVEPSITGTSAEQSQKWLMNGNLRFMTKKFRADGRADTDRARTSKEQKPHAIILSCSDSRVPPELIFDQGLGEITTIRVAGEVLDSSVIASIEQVILNQAPHLLVVLGHTQCDSIEATLKWKELASHGSDALDRMVAEIKPHLKTVSSQNPSPKLQVEGALQADGVARDLTERSSVIKKAVDSGQLKIKSALYWIDTGEVRFY